jgi:hypothetical protein
MKKLIDIFFSHSVFIAVCACCLTAQGYVFFNLTIDKLYLITVFFGTLAAYNAYWLLSKIDHPKNAFAILFGKLNTSQVYLTLLASLVACISSIFASGMPLLFILAGSVLYFLYSSFLALKKPNTLLGLFLYYFIKTASLSACWVIATVCLPLFNIIENALIFWMYAGIIFFFMLELCLIFDKRDVSIDSIAHLHINSTNKAMKYLMFLGEFVCAAALIFSFIILLDENMFQLAQVIVFGGLVCAGMFTLHLLSHKKRGYYFYYFWVDGMMIFSFILMLLAKSLA